MGKIVKMEYFRVPPRWLFVKVEDEDGNIGWGEASLEGHTQAVEGCLDSWFEICQSLDADNIEYIWQLLWRGGFYRGGPVFMSALSGIDIALWDMKGRKLGVPIWQLLGGRVRERLRVYGWIGGDTPSDVEAEASARKKEGFTAVKMNGTGPAGWLDSPKIMAEVVDRVKQVKATGIDVAVDFHGRLHKPMAKQLAKALEPHQPLFIEEPLLSEHIGGISGLSGLVSCPIALGERLYSRWDVRPFLESGSIDVLQPDICHVGGISEVKRIVAMCETYDVAIAPHCPLGPIALAASLQVDTVAPNFAIQEMSIGMHYNKDGYDLSTYIKNSEVWKVTEGHLAILSRPGLGIDVDEEAVRCAATKAQPWPVPQFRGPDGEIREW